MAIWIKISRACDYSSKLYFILLYPVMCGHPTLNFMFLLHSVNLRVLKCVLVCTGARFIEQSESGTVTEGGLTTVECWGAIDVSRHERRFCLLPNRVVPHPADPTLEERARHNERIDNKLNIETRWVDFVTQWGFCNQNCRAGSNLQRTINKHARQRARRWGTQLCHVITRGANKLGVCMTWLQWLIKLLLGGVLLFWGKALLFTVCVLCVRVYTVRVWAMFITIMYCIFRCLVWCLCLWLYIGFYTSKDILIIESSISETAVLPVKVKNKTKQK